ncbi:MAG: DUF5655 domain-containing protein [Hyphomicrobium sp.]
MATDYGEKERAFIDGLKENTGRDLGEWMQAIATSGQSERNDIIDWLRHKGLMFSKASWLERIHHNGGKPIYAGAPKEAAPRRPPRRRDGVLATTLPATSPPPPPSTAAAPATTPVAPPAAPPPASDVEALLAKAKAYRPLAQHVLAKIKSLRPGAALVARESAIAIGDPNVFAALGISAKELRLHLALGEHPFDDVVKKGQPGGGLGKGEALSHMLVLTDARQVNQRLMDLIVLAKPSG